MAIEWKWSAKCGEATFRREDGYTYNVNLYVGNCFLIMVYEYKDDGREKYNLSSFFVDEEHMERCLKNNIFSEYETLTAITINKAKCRNYKKIVALLAEYMDDIDISVYKDGEYIWKEYAEPKPIIPDVRMREIAEQAVSCLCNEETIEDLVNDIDLTPEEMDYFGIDYEEDEDE